MVRLKIYGLELYGYCLGYGSAGVVEVSAGLS